MHGRGMDPPASADALYASVRPLINQAFHVLVKNVLNVTSLSFAQIKEHIAL